MPKQTKLEKIAIEERNKQLATNVYNTTNEYSEQHTRALSDDETPIQGKGTGKYMDTKNGGGYEDIHGIPGGFGTGRLSQIAMNEYNIENQYETPDTSANIGQIKI